jgi:hypothetical protein
LRFPSWTEFTNRLSNFEQDISNKIRDFKGNHPVLDKAIKASFYILPPPFNSIAENIYDTAGGSEEEKFAEVISYFKQLQVQGEDHYNQVTQQLESILIAVQDVRAITAKEETVRKIQEILVSTGSATNEKLDDLRQDLSTVITKVDRVLDALGNILKIIDNTTGPMKRMVGEDERISVQSEQRANTIILKRKGVPVRTITAQELRQKLSIEEQQLIVTYEQSMSNYYQLWRQVYPQLSLQVDPITKAKLEVQLKDIVRQMCSEWSNILTFLGDVGYVLDDHYIHIKSICQRIS